MGAERSQWQFPANEVGKVIGWSDEASPSNPSASKGLVNKGPFVEPGDIANMVETTDTDASGFDFVNSTGPLADSDTTLPAESVVKAYVDASIKDYDVNADVEAATVPAAANFVRTAGHTDVGDGGDATYAEVVSAPDHDLYLTEAGSGRVFAITKRTIRASLVGAFPSTSDANLHTKLISALAYLEDVGGGCLELDKNDIYEVDGQIALSGFSSHIRFENTGGGIIKAASGLAVPVMQLTSGTTEPGTGRFTAESLRIDNSGGSYSVGASSATGLSVTYLDHIQLNNFECVGGYDPNVGGTPSTGGDSGLSTVGCRYGVLVNPYISAQPDAGIYPNWDNSGDEGGYIEVIGGTLYRNKAAVTAKRNLSGMKSVGTKFIENDAGVTTNWVDNGGWIEPCKKIEVIGCSFIRGIANLIAVKRNTKLIAIGNLFEDIGCRPDGSNSAGANARAIRISGTTGALVRGNTFRMREISSNLEYAFSFAPDTDSGSSYTGGSHNIGDNIFENWYRHSIGGTSDTPSVIGLERITSTMETNSINATDVNASSRYEYVIDTAPHVRKIRKGISSYFWRNTGLFPQVTVDLTPLGTLTAGSTTAVQTATITGLTSNDGVQIDRLSSTLVANPGIAISWRTAADSVQYYFRNNTGSSYDFTGQSIRISS